MKKLFILFILLPFLAKGQVIQPAKWSFSPSKKEVKTGEKIDLIFTAKIDKDWYLYSSDFDPTLGPMVTSFSFESSNAFDLVGKIKPVGAKKKFDEIWGGDVTYFVHNAEFRQTILIKDKNLKVTGKIEYQVCNDIDGKCIPFEEDFEFGDFVVTGINTRGNETENIEKNKASNLIIDTSKAVFPKLEIKKLDTSIIVNETKTEKAELKGESVKDGKSFLAERNSYDPYSLLAFVFFAFAGGLAALLTPCVFPMIPLTVTFFTTRSPNRKQAFLKALIYGFSIIFIYTFIGTLFSMVFGAETANDIATSATANIIFFIVFLIFALSFFGLFEITLPSSFVNRINKQTDKGGYYGVFFMAFTLVLVSFSCTGPIVGSILVESTKGQFLKPLLGMFGFSLAFALPFTLFAVFPHWIQNLPKSGGWLNSVKVVLGFIELALGLKFLSVADAVYSWGILDREVYLAIWIAIFGVMGFYLLGKIRLPHDSETKEISVGRLILAIATFSFVVYLIPGMFGAPLKALSGYLPPSTTQDFDIPELILENAGTKAGKASSELCEDPKYADFLHFPHGIKGYFDYKQALDCSKKLNKPIFVDFTGKACVNCREMEARVWSDPEVLKRLKNDFVVLALYVDEKTELPEAEWYISKYDNKLKKTIGKQNADLQISRFNNNAQPYYLILDANGELIAGPQAYNLSIPVFVEFLEKGKSAFQQRAVAVQ